MPQSLGPDHKNWKHSWRVIYDEKQTVLEYSLSFYRKREGRWYDEIRYDSHERKRGRKIPAPHLHVKLQSGRKGEIAQAVEEIKSIIDNYVPELEGVIR